jgi:hypothetical protein
MLRTLSLAFVLGAMALGIALSTQQLKANLGVCSDYACVMSSQCNIAGLGCNVCNDNRCGN